MSEKISNKIAVLSKSLAKLIDAVNTKFDGRFTIDNSSYNGLDSRIDVDCEIHGTFNTVSKNLRDSPWGGCLGCRGDHNLPKFLDKAFKIHGDRYDYSLVEYDTYNSNLEIVCGEHGSFHQTPQAHVGAGSGCPACGKERVREHHLLTTEEFIKRSTARFSGRYTYEDTVYVDYNEPVKMTCKVHGTFLQKPRHHAMGLGCQQCGWQILRDKITLTRDGFLERCRRKHGDKYDYSQAVYVNNYTKIKILCSVHGVFEQEPSNHFFRTGCPGCGNEKRAQDMAATQEHFIKVATEVHGTTYDYSLSKYYRKDVPVKIICNRHGVFEQYPSNHYLGSGCPKCARMNHQGWINYTLLERKKKRFIKESCSVYLFRLVGFEETDESVYKIGISVNIGTRLKDLKYTSRSGVIEVDSFLTNTYHAYLIEQELHKMFKAESYETDLRFGGNTELFILNDSDVVMINQIFANLRELTE